MSYLKRAWLSVVRRKGKSLILLIVVFILGNLIAGAFAIKQATERVEGNLKDKLGYNASIQIDEETIWADFDYNSPGEPNIPKIPSALIEKIGALPEVDFFDYSRQLYLLTKSLKNISYDDSEDSEDMEFNFNMHGVEHLEILDSKIGRIELESGRTFTEEDLGQEEIPVLLSEEVMTKNNLRLDEVFEVKKRSEAGMMFMGDSSETEEEQFFTYKLKVVGTFKPVSFGKDKNNNFSIVEMMNRIYLPNEAIVKMVEAEIKAAEESGIDIEGNNYLEELVADNFTDSVFVTESNESLDNFIVQAESMLEEGLMIKTSQDALETISFSIKLLKDASNVMLKGSAIITVIVLSLVVVLFLRDRKHEMGIYIAIGDPQWKVLSQVTLEVLMITLMGLTLSFGSGMVLANKASEAFIFDNYGQEVMIDTWNSYIPAVNLTEVNEDYEIKITPSYVISTYAIGTVVAIASSVIPMFYVTRMKPKKILM